MLDHSSQLSIRTQCALLGLSRANLYYNKVDTYNTDLANEMHSIWLEFPYYGYRKMHAELLRRHYLINRKKVQRLCKLLNLQSLQPKKNNKSLPNKGHEIYPYLLSKLSIESPNQVWATDITYIKLQSGFVYLIALIDWHSRYIIDWSLLISMEAEGCVSLLERTLKTIKPEVLNTDQGAQFTSEIWISLLKDQGIKISMDGKGRWADNIYIERFWRTIKYE